MPGLYEIMGAALGETRAELEEEYNSKFEALRGEIAKAMLEAFDRQQGAQERELALLRGQVSKLQTEVETLREASPPARAPLKRVK